MQMISYLFSITNSTSNMSNKHGNHLAETNYPRGRIIVGGQLSGDQIPVSIIIGEEFREGIILTRRDELSGDELS
jgi:hypothetical protein